NFIVKMAHDRAFRSNSFGISATIAFAFVMPNSRYIMFPAYNLLPRAERARPAACAVASRIRPVCFYRFSHITNF
ncbi:hypothetical protein, partial [Leptospira noguchii]|uniref:hypothetical protein n=1 Tax=Leptospira noguchii TaxID=28182 RepID=UPI0009E224F9